MKLSTSAGLTLAITLALLFPAVAKADDLLSGFVHDTLRVTGTAVKGANNILVGTVDSAGNVLDATGHIVGTVTLPGRTVTTQTVVVGGSTPVVTLGTSNEVYGYSIATRRNDLRQAVQLAEAQSKISTSQAATLRAELDQNASSEANATADNVLTFDEALNLARDLDKYNTELSTMMSMQPFNRLVVVDNSGVSRILVVNRSAIADGGGTIVTTSPIVTTTPGSTETTTEVHRSTINGVTTSTETVTTKVVPATEVTTEVFITTLEGRRLQLEGAIAAGQAAGRITEAQARVWRAELDQIARAQAAGRTTTFDYVTALPLAMSLDYIGNVVMTSSPTVAYVPLINGQRFIFADGRVIMLDDVMVRRADLESKISRKLAAGRLSDSQARTLRAELGDVARVEAGMRSHGSSFTPKEASTLYKMFDKVGSNLDEMAGK